MTRYGYEIVAEPSCRDTGWRLRLLCDGAEIDHRVFSIDPARAAPSQGIRWWNAMADEARDHWMHAAGSPRPVDAYHAFLLASAHIDAEAWARAWLASCQSAPIFSHK